MARPRRKRTALVVPPKVGPGQVAITVVGELGDYRAGDEIWCDQLEPEEFGRALNRDVLVPRPAGRFLFGRLIGRERRQSSICSRPAPAAARAWSPTRRGSPSRSAGAELVASRFDVG